MRLALILALAAQTALGFTDAIWQNPPALYTNALGMEFVGETVLRSRWAGDTNWNYVINCSVYTGDIPTIVATKTGSGNIIASDGGGAQAGALGVYVAPALTNSYGFSIIGGYYGFAKGILAGDTYQYFFSPPYPCSTWSGYGEGVVNLAEEFSYVTNYSRGYKIYPVTNAFGSIFQGNSYTSSIPFRASEADKITRQLEAVLPAYVLPCYSSDPDYSFDSWFSNRLERWPGGSFPKANLFWKMGETNLGAVVYGTGTNTVIGEWHNAFGELAGWPHYTNDPDLNPVIERIDTPTGYWIKRRDRINPMVVAEWRQYGNTVDWAGDTNNWEYYHGWPNEFIPDDIVRLNSDGGMGSSQLFGLEADQHPVFIVHLGGTNKYTSGLSLKLSDENYYGDPLYVSYEYRAWDTYAGFIGEWTDNYVRQKRTCEGLVTNWWGGTIALNSATQRSDHAWLALGAPLKLTGTSPNTYWRTNIVSGVTNIVIGSGDTVSLQYTNKMTTYEGTKVWDNILLPEQLTAHYVAMTNMFLVPWTDITWTNSTYYSNYNYEVMMPGTNLHATGTNILNECLQPWNVVPWWEQYCPVIPDVPLTIEAGTFYEAATNPLPPSFTLNMNVILSFTESYESISERIDFGRDYGCYSNFPSIPWYWTASRDESYTKEISGVSIGSCVSINNLYTGTLHRAHIYINYTDDNWITNTPMHRVELTDWTTAPTIISDEIRPWQTVDAGVLTSACAYTDSIWSRDCAEETCNWYKWNEDWANIGITNMCAPVWSTNAVTNITDYIIECTQSNASSTNITIEFFVTSTTNFVSGTNVVSGTFQKGQNPCWGYENETSNWDQVSWDTHVFNAGSNIVAAFTNEELYIWQDPYCEDFRTNITKTVLADGFYCEKEYTVWVPKGAFEGPPGTWTLPPLDLTDYTRSWLEGGHGTASMAAGATYNRYSTITPKVKVLIEWQK